MNVDEFSIILPSNSSMLYFPDNTTTSFITKLPKEIELHGKWHVGLGEIHIPCTMLHLKREDTVLFKDKNVYFQHGVYNNIEQLVDSINDTLLKYYNNKLVEKLFYNKYGGYVTIQNFNKHSTEEPGGMISETVKRILGFDTGGILERLSDGTMILISNQPASLSKAIPDQLYVYSNLCEPSIVGDTHAPLLRIVNFNYKQYNFGTTVVKSFDSVAYVPLLFNKFHLIDIDIRDQFGKPLPFEFGTLTLTLRFKKHY